MMSEFLFKVHLRKVHLRNELNFWHIHGILNTLGLLQS